MRSKISTLMSTVWAVWRGPVFETSLGELCIGLSIYASQSNANGEVACSPAYNDSPLTYALLRHTKCASYLSRYVAKHRGVSQSWHSTIGKPRLAVKS